MTTPAPAAFEIIKVLSLLICSQLQIPENRGIIYNQKKDLPTDDGLLFSVSMVGSKIFGSNTYFEDDEDNAGGLVEVQGLHAQETYQVDVFSRDSSARLRAHEIVMALSSTQAQQLAEKYQFKWGFIPTSFVDVSFIEASARLNRYALTFNVLRSYEKRNLVPAFTNFEVPPKELLINP